MSIREDELIEDLQAELAEYKQRAEAAEAKLRELEMQEPVACIRRHINDDPNDRHLYIDIFKEDADRWLAQFKPGYAWLDPLYAKPFPAPKQEEK